MPKHDLATDEPPMDDLNEEQAEQVEQVAMILAEHLYAQPNMNTEQDEQDDCSLWEHTSEENKRIYRSCALDVYRRMSNA